MQDTTRPASAFLAILLINKDTIRTVLVKLKFLAFINIVLAVSIFLSGVVIEVDILAFRGAENRYTCPAMQRPVFEGGGR